MGPLSEWSKSNRKPTPRSKPQQDEVESPLGERCHFRIALRQGPAFTQQASQCGTTLRVVQDRESQPTADRPEPQHGASRITSRREVPLSDRSSTGASSHPARRPSVGPLSEWSSRIATNSDGPSRSSAVVESPLGERCHIRIVLRQGSSSHPARRPSVGPLSEWSRSSLNQPPRPKPAAGRIESPLGERCHFRIVLRQGSALTQQGVPVWDHSPSGPVTRSQTNRRSARRPQHGASTESPLGERCHFRIALRKGQLFTQQASQCGTTLRVVQSESQTNSQAQPATIARKHRHGTPGAENTGAESTALPHLSERGATFGSLFEGASSHPPRRPSVGPLSEWSSDESQPNCQRPEPAAGAESNHLSERGATFGSFFGGANSHPAGVPVWDHSPSGPSDESQPMPGPSRSRPQ